MSEPEEKLGQLPSNRKKQQGGQQQKHLPLFAPEDSSEKNQTESATASSDNYSYESGNFDRLRMRMWKIVDGNSGMWTAIFTGFLVVFTFLLYQVADRQDETSRMTQRATVSLWVANRRKKLLVQTASRLANKC